MPNVAENLERVAKLIAQTANAGAKLILLPEFFAQIKSNEDINKNVDAEDFGDINAPIQKFLISQAKKYKVWLIGGSVALTTPNSQKVTNSLLAYNPQGECVCRYDKIHLFKFTNGGEKYDESEFIKSGEEIVVFTAQINKVNINICPSICYDLRFPELYRQGANLFANNTIDLILLPAAFTYTTGKAHWQTLIQARAIENQCFVLASAQGGEHKNNGKTYRHTFGNSIIINSWGEVLSKLEEGEGVVISEFDINKLEEVRNKLPALKSRCL